MTDTSETSAPPPSAFDLALERALDAIALVCKVLTGLALVALTLIFGWLVWGRYILNDTPTWVEQMALLLIMLITFLGAAVGIRETTHLSVTYFRDAAPRGVRFILLILTHLVMAGFGAVMAWHSYALVLFKWGSEIPLINLPEGLRAIPIMVCGGLIFLFSLGHMIALVRQRIGPAA
jgi:TRAP-type C4-dicarboxylate transport system permease small subunit